MLHDFLSADRLRRLSPWFAAGALLLAFPRSAHAQYWLQDRASTEGRGIRSGNFELHPGIGAEIGYDSNVFYYPSSAATPALRLRISPSFSIATLGPQRSTNSDSQPTALPTVNFRGGVALIYHEFIPITSPDRVSSLRNLGAQANVRIELFPQRTWQFNLSDDFTRTIQPGSQLAEACVSGAGCAEIQTLNRDYNHAQAELAYVSGGGRGTLEVRAQYALNVSVFESSNVTRYNYLQHEIGMRIRWRFLPKTALLWEGTTTPLSYNTAAEGTGLFSSVPVSTRIGINGLITQKIGLLVMVGYAATFFSGGDNLDTVVGQAELRYLIDDRSSFKLGFIRDIQNSFFGNYYLRDRGYANYSQSFFNGRFLLALDAGVSLNNYGYVANRDGTALATVSGMDPSTNRFSAVRADGGIFGEYRLSDVFGINATFRATANISDTRLGTTMLGADGMPGQPIAWSRFEGFIGGRANW